MRSLDFIAAAMGAPGTLNRYYTVSSAEWSGRSTLQDYALVAHMFFEASERLQAPRYRRLARRTVDKAIADFYNAH